MNEYIKLAWRNIWRNKRRTLITAASVFFAILFALIMRSMQKGSYSFMIDSFVQNYSGYIQLHERGYWDEQTINNTFTQSEALMKNLDSVNNISAVIPRLESFALASYDDKTKGAMVVGINPEKEANLTDPKSKLVKGDMFTNAGSGVLLTQGLAQYLGMNIGDTLALISQGYHGVSAAGLYPVAGIIDVPQPDLNKRLIYLHLKDAQQLYGAYNRLTSLVFNLHSSDKLDETLESMRKEVDLNEYEIMSWRDISPELVQQIQSDRSSGYIMLAILYIIVGFGVFGTVMMMTSERKREFGVMIAIGMHKTKLAIMTILEMIFIGLMGIGAGIATSIPIILYFYYNPIQLPGDIGEAVESFGIEPIMPFAWQADYFVGQSLIVLALFFIAIIYPIYSITKIKAVSALRA